MPDKPIRFFDPAFGTGVFLSALLRVFDAHQINYIEGYEIDKRLAGHANNLWQNYNLTLHSSDFTCATVSNPESPKANLIICNPPYIRHQYLRTDKKDELCARVNDELGLMPSARSGMYMYFLLLAHAWLAQSGYGVWLVPDHFLNANYGQVLKEYLLKQVQLIRIHRYPPKDSQFANALVSTAVIVFRNIPPNGRSAEISSGTTLSNPTSIHSFPRTEFDETAKWSHYFSGRIRNPKNEESFLLGELFNVKRGLATGANDFFIMSTDLATERGIAQSFLKPILPGSRYIPELEIQADDNGNPLIKNRQLLLDCRLDEEEIRIEHPTLWAYLETGRQQRIHERYLCRKRKRWYFQENRPPAPILCTYMRRDSKGNTPLRFIRNYSGATAANGYLMLYPTSKLQIISEEYPDIVTLLWRQLNQTAYDTLTDYSRTYGGGLVKMEPNDLQNVPLKMVIDGLPPNIQNNLNAIPR